MIHTSSPEIDRILQAALDSLSAQVAVLDESGAVIAENRAWKALADEVGAFPVASLGENYPVACSEAASTGNERAAAMEEAVRAALRGEPDQPMVQVSAGPEGSERWFEAFVTLYSDGDRSGTVVTLEDVTEHKQAETALGQSRRFVEKILGTVPNVIYVYDLEKRQNVYINDRVGPLLGYSSQEIREMGDEVMPILAHPYDIQAILEHHGRLAQSESDDVQKVEYRLKHKTRGWRWFASRDIVFERAPDGTPRQILGSAQDVTQAKEDEFKIEAYQARLRSVARQVGSVEEEERRRIAADLHDVIGQGLIALSLQLAALKALPEEADIRERIGDLEEQIATIVQETRGLTFEISPPVLYELGLSAAVRWLGEKIEEAHDVRVELDERDRAADLDQEASALMFRGVRELLMNVVKHADTQRARVGIDRDGEQIVVVVDDHGAGFNASRLEVVDDKSAGFGLFSLRERLAAIDGSLEVRSTPGSGTRVTMRARISA